MKEIIEIMSNMKKFISSGAVDINSVKIAEERLKVKFSDEYKEYVMAFGSASYYRHELTGICKGDKAIDVVEVTLAERTFFPNIPKEWYVIEQTHIDGIVVWQDSNGNIYKATPQQFVKICDSLKEYVIAE